MTDATGPAGRALSPPQRGPIDDDHAPPRTNLPAGRDHRGTAPPLAAAPPPPNFRRYRTRDIGNAPRQWRSYTREDVLDELRRVAALVPERNLTIARFGGHSRLAASTVHRAFGLWRTALEQAGLERRYSGCPITDKLRRKPGRGKSAAELLAELRAIAAAQGGDTVTVDQVAASPRVSLAVYYRRFGSFRAAVKAAGLRERPSARRYSDALCWANLAALWRHYGRAPRSAELDRPPSTVSMQAYRIRFRTVRRALALYVLRANAQGADPPLALPDAATAAIAAGEKRRDARGTLRFTVLERDRFRCVACGNSPATDPACKLHVDHIEPYSKGGKTTLDNLRTLCAACNWSRGDGGEVYVNPGFAR